jgi:hypothetical protein
MILQNWKIVPGRHVNEATAPEAYYAEIIGDIFGHPKHEDGKTIQTSRIVQFEAFDPFPDFKEYGKVKTQNGSIYYLGEPDLLWSAWLEKKGLSIEDYEF